MKLLKRTGIIFAVAAVIFGLTACGGNGKETDGEGRNQSVEESVETQSSEMQSSEMQSSETFENEATQSTEVETTASEAGVSTEPEEFILVAGLSENYADLEKRCFAYNGQIFTLGESTLQDLIDGGIPFRERDLNNVGNNVNRNYGTGRYTVEINDYVSMQFAFTNTTDTNLTEAECLLSSVRWYPLYVPQSSYDESRNEEIITSINDAAKTVCFSFPLTLTKEQLLENNSDATEINEYNEVSYKIDSEMYLGNSGYYFKFNKNTNQLEDVTISWLP